MGTGPLTRSAAIPDRHRVDEHYYTRKRSNIKGPRGWGADTHIFELLNAGLLLRRFCGRWCRCGRRSWGRSRSGRRRHCRLLRSRLRGLLFLLTTDKSDGDCHDESDDKYKQFFHEYSPPFGLSGNKFRMCIRELPGLWKESRPADSGPGQGPRGSAWLPSA